MSDVFPWGILTNQKPTIDTQKQDRKEHKKNTKENPQITRGESKRRRKKQRRNTKKKKKQNISNKMAISIYLSIITLYINGPVKRHRVADWVKKKSHQCAA